MTRLLYILLIPLLLAASAFGAEYYLDITATGANNGSSWTDAWETLGDAQTALEALGDNGSGDTLILRDGNYGGYWETQQTRTDWLTVQADTGHSPVVDYFSFNASVYDEQDSYVHFIGITFTVNSENAENNCGSRIFRCNYITFEDCIFNGIPWAGDGDMDYYDWFIQEYGFGVYIGAGSSNIIIDNCTFAGYNSAVKSQDSTGTRGAGFDVTDVTVTNCDISRCRYPVFNWGKNFTITNNHIYDFYAVGIINLAEGLLIENNHIENGYNYTYLVDESSATYNNTTGVVTADAGTPYSTITAQNGCGLRITVGGSASDWATITSFTDGTITISASELFGAEYGGVVTKVEVRGYFHGDAIQIAGDTGDDHITSKNVEIKSNVCHNLWAQGIYCNLVAPDMVDGFLIENNLIYDTGAHTQIYILDSKNVVIRNNTVDQSIILEEFIESAVVANNIAALFADASKYSTPQDVTVDYYGGNIVNSYWGTNPESPPNIEYNDTDSFEALFTDYDNEDYTLAAGSAAIGYAIPAYTPTTDVLGNIRDSDPDTGAYEYGAEIRYLLARIGK